MEYEAVPSALRERLGPEGIAALLDLFDMARHESRDDVMTSCSERFERRLVEEVSTLRVDIVEGDAALRQEMTQLGSSLRQEMGELRATLRQEMAELRASLRQEMGELRASLRQEMTQLGSGLRQEMTELRASLRQEMMELGGSLRGEMSAGRVELLKWCFAFWVGQVIAVTGLLTVMLRVLRP